MSGTGSPPAPVSGPRPTRSRVSSSSAREIRSETSSGIGPVRSACGAREQRPDPGVHLGVQGGLGVGGAVGRRVLGLGHG